MSEDVLRIRWSDCLPTSVQRLLRVFRPLTSLDDLTAGADKLVETTPPFVTSGHVVSTSRSWSPGAPRVMRMPANDTAAKLAAIRIALVQFTISVTIATTRREIMPGRRGTSAAGAARESAYRIARAHHQQAHRAWAFTISASAQWRAMQLRHTTVTGRQLGSPSVGHGYRRWERYICGE